MKKLITLAIILLLAALPASCSQVVTSSELFAVQLLTDSPEIYRIDYIASLDGKYLCMGGIANFDHAPLNDDPDLLVYFSQDDLEGKSEGNMSLELHIYGENEDHELAATDPVEIPAKLGSQHTVSITGNSADGFNAQPAN